MTATLPTCTLSLHDALPRPPHPDTSPAAAPTARLRTQPSAIAAHPDVCTPSAASVAAMVSSTATGSFSPDSTSRVAAVRDRKSTRLNSSHLGISYAVLCFQK